MGAFCRPYGNVLLPMVANIWVKSHRVVVVVVVASCGATKAGSFAFRAPATFFKSWTIQLGVLHSEGLKTSRSEVLHGPTGKPIKQDWTTTFGKRLLPICTSGKSMLPVSPCG